ncbi:MAG: hypothetical protein ACRDNR_03285 [Gaiellaceae bacterium]
MTEEQRAYERIEEQAAALAESGYEPVDSEPGEWLRMQNPETGETVLITPDEEAT